MALNANTGLRALAATTLLVSILPLSAQAGPRDAAPIDFVRISSVEQARPTRNIARVGTTTPRLNPKAVQDTWRGPVTHTGSGALPAVRRRIHFSYPGSVRTPVTAQPIQVSGTALPDLNGAILNNVAISSALSSSDGRMVAGHPTLPLNSLAHVRNPETNAELVVQITSRTAARREETLTLSSDAADLLGILRPFGAQVAVEYLGVSSSAPIEAEPAPQLFEADFERPAPVERPGPVERQATPTPATGSLYVQVGSFTEPSKASSVAGGIGGGLSSGVQAANVRGQTYHRVMVGPFQSRDAADRARASLRQLGFADGFVTSG
ncbi:SPOR domain-containing protein [Henriciella barbarensis]|uniref:SPOR domain-containing protein n=1 Tax=Henriciella barbarensis TaxID=86342 RepID=A0A399QSZ1_9PROT|nr:SPOR domain-containing protein [Henriciella barbarensis]